MKRKQDCGIMHIAYFIKLYPTLRDIVKGRIVKHKVLPYSKETFYLLNKTFHYFIDKSNQIQIRKQKS